jgi:endoglucanase
MTDGGTFHERAQHFLSLWICGSDQTVQYTPRGRAWNRYGGSLGETANAVFLAAAYSKYLRNGPSAGLADRYTCWARSQVTLLWNSMLGLSLDVV